MDTSLVQISKRLSLIETQISELQAQVAEGERVRQREMPTRYSVCSFPVVCRILLRYGALSPSLILSPRLRDPLTTKIVELLLLVESATISGLSRDLHKEYGRGARQTVAKHLKKLRDEGIVAESRIGSSRSFRLTDAFLARWLKLIDSFGRLFESDTGSELPPP